MCGSTIKGVTLAQNVDVGEVRKNDIYMFMDLLK